MCLKNCKKKILSDFLSLLLLLLALLGLTSVFEMGTGVPPMLLSLRNFIIIYILEYFSENLNNVSVHQIITIIVKSSIYQYRSTHHIAMLPSPAYQRCSLQRILLYTYGKTHLKVGFTLRCFQRLSIPYIATLHCNWRYNSQTSGRSIPVLSY